MAEAVYVTDELVPLMAPPVADQLYVKLSPSGSDAVTETVVVPPVVRLVETAVGPDVIAGFWFADGVLEEGVAETSLDSELSPAEFTAVTTK